MSDLFYSDIASLNQGLESKAFSAVELMQSVIDRTDAVELKINAFVDRDVEDALKQGRASDERRARGESLGPFDGIPVGIKDILAVKDQSLRCASKMLEGYHSPYDATCITKLKEAGAIIWGRLNMDEFAMGSSTENSAYGFTANPWNLDCIPGGSSGGSAAAVSAGEAIVSLGTDTGGSIRQPAAFCGVVGMKPTYGLVSRYGLVAFASSLDQVGPLSRNVKDSALLLETITGHDPLDSTSLNQPKVNYSSALDQPTKKMTLGVPKEFFQQGIDQEVKEAVEKAIAWYGSKGYAIEEISLPHSELCVPVYYIIATAEASSNLARFDGVRYSHRSKDAENMLELFSKSRGEGFGEEVKRRIILGTYVLSSGYYDAYYLRAQKVRSLIRQDFEQAFTKVDAIITPTSPTPAFQRGEKNNDPLAMYLNDIYTISVNLAGLPALSLPVGMTQNDLPIGMQVIGKAFGESDILSIAHDFEKNHEFKNMRPKI
ncbi:MAG: Asp-tRNA(Asn)/Glu-tRNA(Gln) amidotransferase GatCAB subunit A [Puniceicoccaceae bacterium MED-G32]|nr:MAG: Asp-tRNA(Asn)/Glu-tRNA(Gln) amidotransferase GatCAB subunit A [Puniceicoccaceae bacterium MED-G32]